MSAPSSIVVACDFSDPAGRALQLARTLHARLHAAVLLVHVEEDLLARSYATGTEWADDAGARRAWLEQRLEQVANDVFGPDAQAVRTRVTAGRAAPSLLEAAREAHADLIVAGTSGKSAVERVLLGSTALALVRSSSIAVLTVP